MEMEAQELTRIVASNVRRRRRELKMTQAELSARTGIPAPDISDIERGLRPPKLSTIAKLADGLSIPPAHLLSAETVTSISEIPQPVS
jgi:transcriptional regulator with XRE-family HTH domain